MAGFVIDSSVAAAWCFKTESTPYTEAILTAVAGPYDALAPHLFAYELRNSILVGVRRGRVTRPDALTFLQSLPDLRLHLADPISYDTLFSLADQYALTVYDAAYLDLALRENLPLASLDGALIRAAGQSGVATFQP